MIHHAGAGELTFLPAESSSPDRPAQAASPARLRLHCRSGVLTGISFAAARGRRRTLRSEGLMPYPERIGGRLVTAGALSRPALRFALALQQLRSGPVRRRLGELVCACGLAPPRARDAALRRQAEDRLVALARLRDGHFLLHTATGRRPDLALEEPLERLVLRIARALDHDAGRNHP